METASLGPTTYVGRSWWEVGVNVDRRRKTTNGAIFSAGHGRKCARTQLSPRLSSRVVGDDAGQGGAVKHWRSGHHESVHALLRGVERYLAVECEAKAGADRTGCAQVFKFDAVAV